MQQAVNARNGSRGITTLSLTPALDRGGRSTPRHSRFTPWRDPVPIVQEAGWALGPVWTGAENLTITVIRSPDHPTRSRSFVTKRKWWNERDSPVICWLLGITHLNVAKNPGKVEVVSVCTPWKRIGGVEVRLQYFLNSALDVRWVVSFTSRLLYRRERGPVPIRWTAWWLQELIWSFEGTKIHLRVCLRYLYRLCRLAYQTCGGKCFKLQLIY